MSGAAQHRGNQRWRNKPHRGRGGASFGRGTQRLGRSQSPNHGTEVKRDLQTDNDSNRGSRVFPRGRGISRDEVKNRNEEGLSLNSAQRRVREYRGRTRAEEGSSRPRGWRGERSGGTSRGGMSRGGTSRGGTSSGGTSSGGTSRGGTSRGGTSRGGTSRGGTLSGGTSRGGTSRSGTSSGGTSSSGTSRGGTSRGGTSLGGTSGGGTSSGGTSSGGTSSGGTSSGGTSRGGTSRGGTSRGGTSRGGTSSDGTSRGGTSRGGTSRGGTSHGGTSRGGTSRGGTSSGGTSSGGTSRGGTSSDGTSSGGTSSGGTSRGGTSRGGTSRGGTSRGGTSSGGTSRGGTSRGGTSSDGTSSGGTSSGGTSSGGTSRGGTSHGGTSHGGTSSGDTSRGNTSRGSTSRGNTSRGSTSRGGTSRGGTSRGGRRDNTKGQLDYNSLSLMLKKDPDELVINLTSETNLAALHILLNKRDLPAKDVVVILRVFARACDSETSRVFLIKLLNKLLGSVYLCSALTGYINCLAYAAGNEKHDLENDLKCMIKLFTEFLRKLPTSFPSLPLPSLLLATTSLGESDQLFDPEIKSSVDNLIALKDEMAERVKKEVEEKANKPKRRQPGNRAALLDNEEPPDYYGYLSVRPQHNDIHQHWPVFIRRNKIEGSYDGPEHYLDVQFRLLREDFIRPLREGIAALSESNGSFVTKPSQDIQVYNGVKILLPAYTSKGVSYTIRFNASKLRHVEWENSKRLIYGSLLCLSKDHFKTFILATVEERKPFELRSGKLNVKFKNTLIDVLEKESDVYEMVETTAYYEAYCHVLEGLKDILPRNFPFERYIVQSEARVHVPFYLRGPKAREVTYDLSCIMKDGIENRSLLRNRSKTQNGEAVKILDVNSWPSAEDLGLDSSQLKAVQLALTKEFAIIQGPPGTGKTYIGLKVAKVLLNNKDHWHNVTHALDNVTTWDTVSTRPILVVCYTNHALDQFLEGIHEFHPEGIVRVGGRSQSEKMQECSLRKIKEKIRAFHKGRRKGGRKGGGTLLPRAAVLDISPQFRDVYGEQKEIRGMFYETFQELESTTGEITNVNNEIQRLTRNVVSEKKLQEYGHMSLVQYKSLVGGFKDWNGIGIKVKPDAMHYWLEVLANPFDFFQSGYFIKPVVVYPLTQSSNSSLRLETRGVESVLQGPDLSHDGSCMLRMNSYIMIPNKEHSVLDTRYSITILLYFYPLISFEEGPIVTFQGYRNVGIQISQAGSKRGKGVLSVTFNSRSGQSNPPLVTNGVLKCEEWNYIGVTYDYNSGILSIWRDGIMVQSQKYPKMEIASYFPVYIGATNHTPSNETPLAPWGKVSSLQIYSVAIGQEQIMTMAGLGIPTEDFPGEPIFQTAFETRNNDIEEEEEPQGRESDVLFEANALEAVRKLEEDKVSIFGAKVEQSQQRQEEASPLVNDDSGEWQVQNSKRKASRAIEREMAKRDMMTGEEAEQITDVWKLSKCDKWRLYRYWIEKRLESYKIQAQRCHYQFEDCAERFKALQRKADLTILTKATIIGMTTTGAAKYRSTLQAVKPRITIVEEAAEVLESHIVTSINPGCQHLILIGDHKQLRPSPNVYELAKEYNLDVSLFERMVRNGMDYQTLHKQHRMRPEIARMMEPIYDDLENHESVLNFENIKGVKENIFFIEHKELEEFVKEGVSRSNMHEAKYLAALCRYFILQGYDQNRITILTMYVGQLLKLKRETSSEIFEGVRICAVDNFQGEENDIILLSLVRSNEEGNIGFLRISNRVCVALSRAKMGFYCIGNLELMCKKEKLWDTIVEDMRGSGNVGQDLTLMCQSHPNTLIHASKAEDFLKAPQGGCMLPCHARLDCGHACRLSCHPKDPEHIEYECLEPCSKTLCELGHKCKKKCYEDCGPCRVPMEKIMPHCNHVLELPCHLDPTKTKCTFACDVKLDCGHQCSGSCHKCFQGRLHMSCEQKCARTLVCGHKCLEICARNCPPCSRECENKCVHQECTNKCGEPCKPCRNMCTWKCEDHTMSCTNRCDEPCNRPRCNKPCNKILQCDHLCIGMCGEPCPSKCRVCHVDEFTEGGPEARFVELQPCGHVIEVNTLDAWIDECCNGITINIGPKRCPECEEPIRTCPRYGNLIQHCFQDVENVKAKLSEHGYDIEKEADRLKHLILFHDNFTSSSKSIKRNLAKKDLSIEHLQMYRNQIKTLHLLSRILHETAELELPLHNQQDQVSLEKEVIMALEARVIRRSMKMGSSTLLYQFSDQEKEEIRNEILRVQLIVSYRKLKMQIQELIVNETDEDDMNLIGQTIETSKRIDEEKLDFHMEILNRIRTSYSILLEFEEDMPITKKDTVDITKKDTVEITNSSGFSQGEWHKCPQGHIYSTADVCPECLEILRKIKKRKSVLCALRRKRLKKKSDFKI